MFYLNTMIHVIMLNALTFFGVKDGIYSVSLFYGVFQTYTHTCVYIYITYIFTSFDITCKIYCF